MKENKKYDVDRYIDTANSLKFDGVDIHELAKKLNEPFYIMSEGQLDYNYKSFMKAFSGIEDFAVYFSLKTNFESEVLRKLKEMGAGFGIAGELGLESMRKTGVRPDKIVVNGPVKSDFILNEAIAKGFHCINVESTEEFGRIDEIAKKHRVIASVGVRIDPLVDRNYYDALIDTYKRKFGFPITEARERIIEGSKFHNLRIEKLHAHIGSQLTATRFHVDSLGRLMKMASELKGHGIEIKEINIGGGYPAVNMKSTGTTRKFRVSSILRKARMLEKKTPSIYDFGSEITRTYNEKSEEYGIRPSISSEPGRFLTSNVGILAGRVVLRKGKWAFTDISMNDVAENAFFSGRRIEIANRINESKTEIINLSGSTLCTADVIGIDIKAPKIEIGDTVVIFDIGAYSISRSSQFTRPRIAAYYIKDGEVKLMRRKETPSEVLATQEW
jgi:diaminopimelate decarboxylase